MPEREPMQELERKIFVQMIEDIEYMSQGVFSPGSVGPMTWDFGEFGIEERGRSFEIYLTEADYKKFKNETVERRGEYMKSGEHHQTSDRGFLFSGREIPEDKVQAIAELAKKYHQEASSENFQALFGALKEITF